MGNAGFISSTVGVGSIGLRFRDRVSESASGFCRVLFGFRVLGFKRLVSAFGVEALGFRVLVSGFFLLGGGGGVRDLILSTAPIKKV